MRRDIKKCCNYDEYITQGEEEVTVRGSTVTVHKYVAAVSRQVQMTSDRSNYKSMTDYDDHRSRRTHSLTFIRRSIINKHIDSLS